MNRLYSLFICFICRSPHVCDPLVADGRVKILGRASRPLYIEAIMRKLLTFLLLIFFCLHSSFAGVSSHQARCSGGTTNTPPVEAVGFLDTRDEGNLNFSYKEGKNGEVGKFSNGTFDVPYASTTRLVYGQTKHLRIGQTIALSALAGVGGLLLLLSKSHTHYLTIEYKDAKDQAQMVSFEVGKDAIQPLLSSLELRTGKKIEHEGDPTSSVGIKQSSSVSQNAAEASKTKDDGHQ
jgi:hypothetical protein